MKPEISVIIPVNNVEEYLQACLDSLEEQGDVSIQTIIVDDGSTDGSAGIMQKYADSHDNCVILHTDNAGPSSARNKGVKHAEGKYIAFLDADDVLLPHTYSRMLRLAERNDAELTICNVERVDSTHSWTSELHRRVFKDIDSVTHISRHYGLINDTTSWNKLIRRDFYESNGFSFPEGLIYEDIPVNTGMHLMADKVAVMREIGYRWRVRDGVTRSLTQETSRMRNLTDRITIMHMLDDMFEKNVSDEGLIMAKYVKSLETDLKLFVDECGVIPDEEALQMLDIINGYIDEVIPVEAFEKLSILNKQKYLHVRERDLPALRNLVEYKSYYESPVTEKDRRLMISLPDELFTVPERDVTDEFRKSSPRVYVDNISVDGNKMIADAHLYWRRFSLREGEQEVKAYLDNGESLFEVQTMPNGSTILTESYGKQLDEQTGETIRYNYDGAAFRVIIDAESIAQNANANGDYDITLFYKNRLMEGTELLKGINAGLTANCNHTSFVIGDSCIRLDVSDAGEIRIRVLRDSPFAEKVSADDGVIKLTLSGKTEEVDAAPLNKDAETIRFDTDDGISFSADAHMFKEGQEYRIVTDQGRKEILSCTAGISFAEGRQTLICNTQKTHSLKLCILGEVSRVVDSEKTDNILRISVRKNIAETEKNRGCVSCRLSVEDDHHEEPAAISSEAACVKDNGYITAELLIDMADDKIFSNIAEGRRDIFVEYLSEDGILREPLYSDDKLLHRHRGKGRRVSIYSGNEAIARIRITRFWPKGEETKENRDILINEKYPEYLKGSLDKGLILFESAQGSGYSGGPRDVYEFIDSHYPEYECIWAFSDTGIPIAGKAGKVRKETLEYYHLLAAAKTIITDGDLPDRFVKRDEQIVEVIKDGDQHLEERIRETLETGAVARCMIRINRKLGNTWRKR